MRAETGKEEGTGTNGNKKMGGRRLSEGKEGRRRDKKKNRKEIEEEVCVCV